MKLTDTVLENIGKQLPSVTSQKTWILTNTAVGTWNLTCMLSHLH